MRKDAVRKNVHEQQTKIKCRWKCGQPQTDGAAFNMSFICTGFPASCHRNPLILATRIRCPFVIAHIKDHYHKKYCIPVIAYLPTSLCQSQGHYHPRSTPDLPTFQAVPPRLLPFLGGPTHNHPLTPAIPSACTLFQCKCSNNSNKGDAVIRGCNPGHSIYVNVCN